MIRFKNVDLLYEMDKPILSDINLHLKKSEIYVIYGASGSGKSTFLETIVGLKKPSAGIINYDNINIYDLNEVERTNYRKKHIGYLPQDLTLIESINVKENAILGTLISTEDKNMISIYEKSHSLLKELGISHLEKKKPNDLSGGEKRKVEITRCFVKDTNIIVMDEPTNNLDTTSIDILIQIIERYNAEGKTFIISTHDSQIKKIKNSTILKIINGKLIYEE